MDLLIHSIGCFIIWFCILYKREGDSKLKPLKDGWPVVLAVIIGIVLIKISA